MFTRFKPFVWFGMFMLVVGLACGAFGGGEPTPVPPTPVPPTSPPTQALIPTVPPTPTPLPAPTQPPPPTPTPEPPSVDPVTTGPEPFYIEEFDGGLENFSYFVQRGVDKGEEMLYAEDGKLVFNIDTRNTWVYVLYEPFTYEAVRIGIEAENRGKNSQSISLICNYSPDGWIEFNMGGDGLYSILAYNALEGTGYNLLYNGGSTDIKLGKDTNQYVAECADDTITLWINGVETRSQPIPKDYRFLDEGQVGFSVSSFESLPVVVEVEWFGIEQP